MRNLFLIAAMVCATAAPAHAERIIVVGASGPSATLFPRGAVLDDRRSATLQPLDRIIVVDKGGTRVFSGPGLINFARGTAAPSRWDDIRSLVTRTRDTFRRQGRGRAGATRSAGPPKPVDPIWALEWPAEGRFCFDADFGMFVHAASAATAETSFEFTDLASRETESEKVAAGRPHFAWPSEMLPQPGGERSFSISAGGVTRTVTIASVPVRSLDPLALAEYVTDKRCEYPLSMFADKADQMEPR